ncbi:MAG TPA: OmpH family outer membrane protein, partial [Gammaproteobacteria bacterium]|nr:OmpH family outer membrane protein [Gammaproteobacteria bacterium]
MRNKIVAAAVAVMLLGCTAYASAADLKIGFVNPAKVSSEAPQAESARKKLEQEFEPRDKEIVGMQKDLQKLEDKLQHDGAVMSDEQKQQLQRKIVSLRRDIQRTQDAFREDFNMRRNEELGKLQRRIIKTVGEFA